MHEIAEKAEFAIGTLYKFFKNKEDLYKALILGQAEKFHDALARRLEKPDDEIEKLRNYVGQRRQIRANVSFIRLYLAETGGASFNVMAGLDYEIRKRYGRFLRNPPRSLKVGSKRKRFKKIAAPYHLAVALDSLTNAFLFLWLEAPDRHPYPENPDTILDILLKGLVLASDLEWRFADSI